MPTRIVEQVAPYLEAGDADGLRQLVEGQWSPGDLHELATSDVRDIRRVAITCLSLVGGRESIPVLATALRDADPVMNQAAEHALWSVWLRSGLPEANHQVARGVDHMAGGRMGQAHACFDAAIVIDRHFAEAWNQRAILFYTVGEWAQAIRDCRRAVTLMPCHFGAWSGMGHCHINQGDCWRALACYRRALEVNPHLADIRQAVADLGEMMGPGDSSPLPG